MTHTEGIILRENLISGWFGCPDNSVANLLAAYVTTVSDLGLKGGNKIKIKIFIKITSDIE